MAAEIPTKLFYLYRITCLINNKIYIGQTIAPVSRWRAHKRDAIDPKIPFHFAIKKYGLDNFIFEIIASCKTQDDANYLETELVKQYDSFISNKGYNATHGGMNAPKSEEFKQMMRSWHASMSLEEKEVRSAKMSVARVGIKYSEKTLQKMSQAKIGIKLSEEHKNKISNNNAKFWLGKSLHPNTIKAAIDSNKKTTHLQEEEIIRKYTSGISQSSLAREYGFSRCVIKRIVVGIQSSFIKNVRLFDDATELAIVNLYYSGLSYRQISKKYKCSHITIKNIIKRTRKS